jgi:Nucleotidyltransferase domain
VGIPVGGDPGRPRSLTGATRTSRAPDAAYRLAGFLNGTHSGPHAVLRGKAFSARAASGAVASLEAVSGSREQELTLGGNLWSPRASAEARLRDSLAEALATKGVLELVLFGSVARESTTGFSDVDAILVVADEHAVDERRLARLRPKVLAAGRAVFEYQPLQHHGFQVVTPRLLTHAMVLTLPEEALMETVSLYGHAYDAVAGSPDPAAMFRSHALVLRSVAEWPKSPWSLHRVVAEFELAPVLYLQATGRPCPKHLSFERARVDFGEGWAPYDVLDQARKSWPRPQQTGLRMLARTLRNPWAAVAVRRRLPAAAPSTVVSLLDPECLVGLRRLVEQMSDRVEYTA